MRRGNRGIKMKTLKENAIAFKREVFGCLLLAIN